MGLPPSWTCGRAGGPPAAAGLSKLDRGRLEQVGVVMHDGVTEQFAAQCSPAGAAPYLNAFSLDCLGRPMRDLTKRGTIAAASRAPKGLAFDIADLVLAKSRAGFRDVRMAIRLDHGSDHEEYEEMLDLRHGRKSNLRYLLWRNEHAVFVQPLIGRRRAFSSVAAALESAQAATPVVVSDIAAVSWPAG